MECEVLFLGFGPITHALATKFITQGHRIIVVTDKFTYSDAEKEFPVDSLITINWKDTLSHEINAEATYFGWRQPPEGQGLGKEIISWIKSANLKTGKLHHLSSASVYPGNQEEFSEIDYDFRLGRESLNPKQALEGLVCEIALEKELKFINYRISNVYGAGLDKGFINESIKSLRNNQPVKVYRHLDLVRDYLFMDDLISALLQLRSCEPLDEVLNISTGQGVSISEVINQLRDLGSIDIKLRQADAPEGLKLKSVLSCKKLEEIITWKPRLLNESLLNLIQNSG